MADGRTNDEKKSGKMKKHMMNGKKITFIEIQKRLNGWQLESFKESYQHKINKGILIYIKRLT